MTGKRNFVMTVFGRKGSGKTTLVKKMLADYSRVIIIDTNQEYVDSVAVVFHNLVEAVDYLDRVGKRPETEAFSMAYVPQDIPDDGLDLLRVAFTIHNCVVVLDESHMYCKASDLPRALAMLIRLGRHKAISQIYIAQRPASVPRDLTAQSDLIVSFQQHEGRDLDYMSRLYGRSAESLKTLAPYTVEVFGTAEAMENIPFAVQKQRAKKGIDAQGSLF